MLRLLKRPNFARYWVSASSALLGSNVSGFVLPTIAVAQLNATAAQLAIIATVQALAFPLLGMFAATAVERRDKHSIIVVTDIVRALAMGLLAGLFLMHRLSVNAIILVSAVVAFVSVFRDVCTQSLLPSLLRGANISKGNAALEVSNTAALSAGPALGGILTSTVGAPIALVVDSLAYLAAATAVSGVKVTPRDSAAIRRSFWNDLREGLAWVFKAPKLARIAGCTATINFAAAASQTVSLIFFYRVLHVSPLVLGLLLATSNAGIIGAWLAPQLEKRLGLISALGIAVGLWTIGRFLLPLAAVLPFPLMVAGLSSLIANLAAPLYNVTQSSYRQRATPLPLQARMHATMRTLNSSTIPIGAAFGGILATAFGVTITLTICALITAGSYIWLAVPNRERLAERTRAAA